MNKIIACLFVVCIACEAPVVDTSQPNITHLINVGSPVVLMINSSGELCSAVVVDDNTLLTARHCFIGAGDVGVWTAPPDALNTSPVSVADTYIAAAAYDIVMVPLLWPLPPSIGHISFSHKAFKRGDTATIVGWGCTHVRAIEARPITYIAGAGEMSFAGTACTGDSGGGIFDNAGAFVATTSYKTADTVGRTAYIGAVSWEAVITELRLDAIAAKQQ